MNTWGRLVALSSVALSITYFAVAAPAGAAAPSRATSASRGPAADPAGGKYVAVTPMRIVDTRIGVGAPEAPIAADATVTVAVGGAGGVPSTGVSAAVLNLTVTQATNGGYVTAYPAGESRPVVSNISFPAGKTRAHLVIAELGTGGQVSLYNGSGGTVQLIVDVSGYYTSGPAGAAGAFTPVTPARLVDTRIGLGAPPAPVGVQGATVVAVLGHGGVPTTGVSAVVLNVTVAASTGHGWEGVHSTLNASVVNFQTGITASNLAVPQVKPTGNVTLYNSSYGTLQLIVDVLGYYTAGAPQAAGLFGPDGPHTAVDTRLGSPIPAHHTLTVPIVDVAGVPAGATAVALNVTVPGGPASGYLSVYAAGTARPVSSTVNFQTTGSIANLAVTALGTNGAVTVYNGSSQPANLALDVAGYVGPVPGPLSWTSPQRLGSNGLTSISCPSATFCMVVNDNGGETTYNGAAWSAQVATGDTPGQQIVSCVSSSFCVVVSDATSSYIYRSGVWTAVPIPDVDGGPRQVSCVSTTFCMAVDFGGHAYAFNGTTWGAPTQLIDPDSGMIVSCVSAAFCMAAGQQGADNDSIFQWDGSHWSTPTTVATSSPKSITCLSTDFCFAVASESSAVYDGSHWSAPRQTSPGEFSLATAACLSSSLCLGFDGFYGAVSTYTAASGWAAVAALDTFGGFNSVACPTSTFCIAVDSGGNIVVGT